MARIGSMFPEIWKHLFKRRATVLYPFERLDIPKNFRGKPIFNPEKCSLKCRGVCAMDCPAQAIVMEKIEEKASRPVFLLERCTFCGQCAESCPFGAITLSEEFELAQYDKKSLLFRSKEKKEL